MISVRISAFAFALILVSSAAWAQAPGVFRQPCVSPGSPPGCDAVPSGPRAILPPERQPDTPTSNSILHLQLDKTPETPAKPPTAGTVTVGPVPQSDAPAPAAPKGSSLKPGSAGPPPAGPPPQ